MADRRCLHKNTVESDRFYKLPPNAQALYMHLTMNADDDGFVNCAESVAKQVVSGKTALKQLLKEGYLFCFDGIYVLAEFRVGNSLKNDRAKPPAYPAAAAKIWVQKNRAYSDQPVDGCVTLLELKNGIQTGIHTEYETDSQKKGTEKKGTEKKGTEPNRSAMGAVDWFTQILDSYPEIRRGSKKEAKEAYAEEIQSVEDLDTALANLDLWKKSEQWGMDGGQYIPYLSNWLARGTWKCQPAKLDKGVLKGASGQLGEAELEAIRNVLADGGKDGV